MQQIFNYTALVETKDGLTLTTRNGLNVAKIILYEVRDTEGVETLYIMMEDMHETVRQVPLPVKLNARTGKPILDKNGEVPMKFKEVASTSHIQLTFTNPQIIKSFLSFVEVKGAKK